MTYIMVKIKSLYTGGPNQDVNYRRNNKNFDDVNDKDERKEANYSMDEFNWTRDKTLNIMTNKNQTGIGNKNTDIDFRNIDQITKDPLAYDSFELQLEHESNIQEIGRLKSKSALLTFKRHANKKYTTDKEESETNYPSLYNDRSNRFQFAPPPGYNKTNLEPTKNKKIYHEVFEDVLEKILNRPADTLKKDHIIDKTESLGKKMLERLDLPGLKSSFDVTVLNKDFDHVKYVDSVMRQSSLPFSERRNIVKKSLDQRLDELYEKYNLKPKQTTKDDLDNVLISMGATLHK